MPAFDKKYDKQNLHEVISDLPLQFSQALEETKTKINPQTKKIVFCGLGGSALPANILKTFLCADKIDFNIPIKISRDYTLPQPVDKNWCGFFDSYSGNTEETLSALKQAEKIGLKQIVVLANNGQLKKIAQKKGYKFIQIPDTKQPRMSYGYIVGTMLKIFHNSKIIDLDLDKLKTETQKVYKKNKDLEKQAKTLAKKTQNSVPLIYASNIWKYLAMVWKINFNENSKVPAFWNAFPELNHNEMVGFENTNCQYKNIIIQDPADHPPIKKRMQTFQKILKNKLNTEIITMPSGSVAYKMFYSLSLGLWTSYYLALLNKLDPAPVKLVERFKKML
ncbi:MAG TPA: bifunctional phosphoglucose/phosphomannose isomerase [Patescibacteria group bacterium]|nr:bifunctional phosphoglucose/phosphomannose isomerase [Patescibacteria group bacterium]